MEKVTKECLWESEITIVDRKKVVADIRIVTFRLGETELQISATHIQSSGVMSIRLAIFYKMYFV